jgi:hypothetical protein
MLKMQGKSSGNKEMVLPVVCVVGKFGAQIVHLEKAHGEASAEGIVGTRADVEGKGVGRVDQGTDALRKIRAGAVRQAEQRLGDSGEC